MRIAGHLASTTLGDVMGIVYRSRATGVLELVESVGLGRMHTVHFEDGLVTRIDTPASVPVLGALLERAGHLDAAGRAWLSARLRVSGGRVASGELLVRHGLVTQEALVEALQEQLQLRLEALYRITNASIRFRPPRGRTSGERPLGPSQFLHGRPRRRDRDGANSPPPRASRTPRPPPVDNHARAQGHGRRPPAPHATDPRARALGLLGLGPSATDDEIRRAFRKAAATLHPDRARPEDVAARTRELALLSEAYHALVARRSA
jgi:hypothetical protein